VGFRIAEMTPPAETEPKAAEPKPARSAKSKQRVAA